MDGGWNWAGNAAKACAIGFVTEGIGEWLEDVFEMGEAFGGLGAAGGGGGAAAGDAAASGDVANAFRGTDPNWGGTYSPQTNAAGGTVWTTQGGISQTSVADMINTAGYSNPSEINVLTGADGLPSGQMISNPAFYNSDLARFGNIPNVNIINVMDLTPEEIQAYLNGPGVTIGAFCNSLACLYGPL
jgi:hypothetical protein